MTALLECYEVEPANGEKATASIVWMHGLFASGYDFQDIPPQLQLPHVRFVFPHAPVRPVTINHGASGPAWYDIRTFEDVPERESEEDVRDSAVRIEALLERERQRGVDPSRTVIAGFSQGAAMALFVGARHEHSLAGIMALSGYHVVRKSFESERNDANQNTEVFFAHGTFDPVVPAAWAKVAKADFDGWTTAKTHWHEYPMEHNLCLPEVAAFGAWLRGRLP